MKQIQNRQKLVVQPRENVQKNLSTRDRMQRMASRLEKVIGMRKLKQRRKEVN